MDGGKIAQFSPGYAGLFFSALPAKIRTATGTRPFCQRWQIDKSPSPVSQDKRLLTQNNEAALSAIAS